MKIALITDPLVTPYGAVRPGLLLSMELRGRGFNVTFISPCVSEGIKNMLETYGIQIINLHVNSHITPQLPTFEAWMRALLKRKDQLSLPEDCLIINTSSCIIMNSHILCPRPNDESAQ